MAKFLMIDKRICQIIFLLYRMYKHCSLEKIINYAQAQSKKYNEPFDKFYDVIISFAKEDVNIIVNDKDIYITNIQIAQNIAKRCFEIDHQMGFFTTLLPVVSDQIMRLFVRGRTIATFIVLPEHRKLHIKDAIITVERQGVRTFGPEIKLLDIMIKLSDPTFESQWEDLKEEEKIYREEWKAQEIKLTGGDDDESVYGGSNNGTVADYESILKKYLSGPERICVESGQRYKIMTALDLNAEVTLLTELFASKNIKIESTYDHPNIPVDMRFRKVTLRHVTRDRRIVVCDIYNCASYGLIPYYENGEVCNIVRMRIYLVDYWIMIIMLRMEMIQESFAMNMCARFKKLYLESNVDDMTLNVIGRIESYDMYLKKKFKNKIVLPYIPATIE